MAKDKKRYVGETVYRRFQDGEKNEYFPVKPITTPRKNESLDKADEMADGAKEAQSQGLQEFKKCGNLESLKNARGAMTAFRDRIIEIFNDAKETAEKTTEILQEQIFTRVLPAIGITAVGGVAYEKFGEIAMSMQETHPFLSIFPEAVCAAGFFALVGGAIATIAYGAGAVEAGIDRKRNMEVAKYAKSKVRVVDIGRKQLDQVIGQETERQEAEAKTAENRKKLVDDWANGRI